VDERKDELMKTRIILPTVALGVALFSVAGCATKDDLEGYATKGDVSSLRQELLQEIRKAQDNAANAESSAAASAAAAERAAADAQRAADKADAIFRKSLRK
jgi:hypothetical protein